jgi:pimeloyl-ACP methyl ester carboxylesterase
MVGLAAWAGNSLPGAAGKIAAVLATFGLGWAGLRLAKKLGFVWMLRTYAFIYRWSRGRVPGIESRIEAMTEHILQTHRRNPTEETLLVGHSVGAMVAVCVAARLVEKTRESDGHAQLPGFHLLTLGQCLPLMSFFRHADHFRSRLQTLASARHLPWTDISARADPLCLFRTDPLHAPEISSSAPDRVRLRVARIFRMFRKESYAKLRWNKIRMHFQYLMASELPTPYDYFEITAGPRSLRDLEIEGD